MDFSFDKVANALYLLFSYENVKSTKEITEGIIVDYGKMKYVIGIEILNFSDRKLNLNDLIQMEADEIISLLVQFQ